MKHFILTLQFLTRIPIPITIDIKEDSFTKGVAYYPLVGGIIGLINVLVFLLFNQITTDYIAIAMVLLANTMVTGAFHLDGLADTCDGIYSSRTKDRMLEIMKDSRVGTNGVLAIIFDLGLRFICLYALLDVNILWPLLLAPVGAKTCVALLLGISKYARKEGLASMYLNHMTKWPVIIALILGGSIFFVSIKFNGLVILLIMLVLSYLYRNYIYKKIDGMTGDTLGAANELLEIVCFILMLIIVI